MAVDNFFAVSSRKRKRGAGAGQTSEGRKRGGFAGSRGGRPSKGKGRANDDDAEENEGRKTNNLRNKRRQRDDEELDDDDDDEAEDSDAGSGEGDNAQEAYESSEDEAAANRKETAAQKRLRLAKQYLETLQAGKGIPPSALEKQNFGLMKNLDITDAEGIDAAELERDIINERLQKDVLEVSGKLHLRIADKLDIANCQFYSTSTKVHRLPLTCAVASEDCSALFTSSKDGSIARYSLSSLLSSPSPEASTSNSQSIVKTDFIPKRPASSKSNSKKGKGRASETKGKPGIAKNQPSQDGETRGHTDEILTLAVSSDGSRLASGGKDRRIGVWDISAPSSATASIDELDQDKRIGRCRWVQGLRGHKDTISSLSFRHGTTQVYTSSFDRTVKVYDAASLSYVETLFGHQDKIYSISVLKNELALSAGGRDKTLRFWKIKDESQLVFRAGTTSKLRRVLEGGLDNDDKGDIKVNGSVEEKRYVEGSADCAAMIDDQHFLSGGDSGSISLWNTGKKKPIFSHALAHGLETYVSETEGPLENPRWILSLATLPYSNIFVSGSWDGSIRFWKISDDIRSFTSIGEIPAIGCVNSLQLLQLPKSRKQITPNGAGTPAAAKGSAKKTGAMLVAALGQEPKFGRWKSIREAKNVALVACIPEA